MFRNKEEFLTKNAVVYTIAILCCLLWASAFPCIKMGFVWLGIDSGDTASQILFGGYRFIITGLLTILIFSIPGKKILLPHKSSWQYIGILALIQTVAQYLFLYIGVANTTAAKSSVINGTIPFISILIACFIFRQEKYTRAKLFGSLLGFLGILIINLDFINIKMDMTFLGEGCNFLSAVAAAFASPLIRIYSSREDPVMLSGYQFLFGGAAMTAVGLAMGGNCRFDQINAVWILIYLAFLTAIAYSLWSILLKYNHVSKITIFSFTIPVFGVFLSAWFLNEGEQAINLQSMASLLLVSLGIIILNKFQSRGKKVASEEETSKVAIQK